MDHGSTGYVVAVSRESSIDREGVASSKEEPAFVGGPSFPKLPGACCEAVSL